VRRVSLDDTVPGMRVARSLHYQYGGVMIAAGATLDERSIAKLREFGYTSLYVHDPDLADVVAYDYIDERARQTITRHVSELYDHLREETRKLVNTEELARSSTAEIRARMEDKSFRRLVGRAKLQETFLGDVEKILESILADHEMALAVGTIKTVHSFLYDHSIEVAVHSALLAKHLGLPKADLRQLVLGSLLHDIGQVLLPEDVARKNGVWTEEEEDAFRQHAVLGYFLLKERGNIGLLSAHVAYQHHENQDGSGYPRKLSGRNRLLSKRESMNTPGRIHRYAEIVAVPDFYDELVSDLPYRPSLPPDQAAARVREAAGTILNRKVVEVFLSYLPVFPVGTSVVVTRGKYRGWRGVVVGVNRVDLSRPLVRLLYDASDRLKKPVNVHLLSDDEIMVRAV